MHIFVKSCTSKSITLAVDPSDSIAAVKRKLHAQQGIETDPQRLLFAGQQMDDKRTLQEYKVTDGSTVELFYRLRGNGRDSRAELTEPRCIALSSLQPLLSLVSAQVTLSDPP